MTTAVARAADGLRPVRGTAGRRVLQVVLFLGALLALGLLFGGEAHATQRLTPELTDAGTAMTSEAEATADRLVDHAEESVPPSAEQPEEAADRQAATPTAGSVTPSNAVPVRDVRREWEREPQRLPSAVVRTVRDDVARPAEDVVTHSAQDTVHELTRVLGSVAGALPPLPHLLPSAPPVPSLPGATDPLPTAPADGAADSVHPGVAAQDSGLPAADTSVTGLRATPLGAVVAGDGTDRAAAPEFRRAEGRSPLDPCGGFGRTPAAETHQPRGADQQAAPVAHGPSFGLTSGAGLPATTAPVRDRSGQILAFPG
ncbi:hypothetical protein OG230_21880 [Streptomyces sp. NBC_00234]|uniref:hypothetical protein n=1 Tax=Streptomyces sp. NBC_00234 TaxID=2903638 RepID=UPI002E2A8E17|nr:hypothetical protein [Streptomyces sp. NBC_00234]